MLKNSAVEPYVESYMDAPDITDLKDQLDKAERDSQSLVANLTDELGTWRPSIDSWSVAQCLDHLARFNEVYVRAMQKAGDHAREEGRLRSSPAVPGLLGGWFVQTVEPPVRAPFKIKAPASIRPSEAASLASALEAFRVSQDQVRTFLVGHSDLDLSSIRFANPFIPGLHFSLATGLHIIAAHERRHLWQAWSVRRTAEEMRRELRAELSSVDKS